MIQPTTRTIASLTVAAILLVGCTPNESSKDVPGIWTDGVDDFGDGGPTGPTHPNGGGDCVPTPLTSQVPLNIAGNNAGGSMTETG